MFKVKREIGRNAFGAPVYSMSEILNHKEVEKTARQMLSEVLVNIELPHHNAGKVAHSIIKLARSLALPDYEIETHMILRREGVLEAIPRNLFGRAELILGQIRGYVEPGSVLDLGCGDGKVGGLLGRAGFTVSLADVYTNPKVLDNHLNFSLFKQGDAVPFPSESFDNTLVLTVLHHSNDPVKLIKEASRVTKSNGRVIVIESVYGVTGTELGIMAQCFEPSNYLGLSGEEQRLINMYFDHFYNRIIYFATRPELQVNVPFNFNTPESWKELFEKEGGLKQEKLIHLGLDQPTVPEYHTLHILRKDAATIAK